MTNEEIFRLAIDKAETNGYKGHLRLLPIMSRQSYSAEELDELVNKILYQHAGNIMRSSEFCMALWPDVITTDTEYRDWRTYKVEMITSENPIKYLEQHID